MHTVFCGASLHALFLSYFHKRFLYHKATHTQLQNQQVSAKVLSGFFVTAFFQTKVYLLALASIFVPSIKMVSPEIFPMQKMDWMHV